MAATKVENPDTAVNILLRLEVQEEHTQGYTTMKYRSNFYFSDTKSYRKNVISQVKNDH